MADEPDNLVLVYLRRIDEKVDRVGGDLSDVKVRLTAIERRMAEYDGSIAGVQTRIDRVEQRLERIEKRLDLIDTPYGGVHE